MNEDSLVKQRPHQIPSTYPSVALHGPPRASPAHDDPSEICGVNIQTIQK